MTLSNIILLVTALVTALISGLFYAYSVSVNGGLGRLPDANYLSAMQSINREILNPLFFLSFMGTLLLLPVCTFMHYSNPPALRFYCLLAATFIYAIGVFGVTVMGNVPLNNMLDGYNIANATAEELSRQRAAFEIPWSRLHSVRTLANVAALVLVLVALIAKR
jgi:uncharacterized membrane protein